jgi:hypothetical protein
MWVVFQYLGSFLMGVGAYTIYEVIDALTGKALSTWFNGGINWILTSRGISSALLERALEGQNLVGIFTGILAFIVFYFATRMRKPAGMP